MIYCDAYQTPPAWAVKLHDLLEQHKIEAIIMVFAPTLATIILPHIDLELRWLNDQLTVKNQAGEEYRLINLADIIPFVDKLN